MIILIGIGILVYPSVSEFLSEKNSSHAVAVYDDTVSKMREKTIDDMFEEAEIYNKVLLTLEGYGNPPVNAEGQPITPESYYRILNIESNGMMVYLVIPKLNETIRIFHGTSEAVLQSGTGHLENTSLPVGGETTHAVLTGHRGLPSYSLFTDLDKLKTGDLLKVTTLYTDLMLRAYASTSAPVLQRLKKGYFVTYQGEESDNSTGHWLKVKYGSVIGWACSKENTKDYSYLTKW